VQGCATGASSVESFLPLPDERDHLQPSNSDLILRVMVAWRIEDDGSMTKIHTFVSSFPVQK
jgi:hypothetical protein